MKRIITLFFVFLSINCFSQFSKTHYIPPLTCITNLAGEQYLYISTPSTNNVNFKIIANGGSTITATVSKSDPYVYPIGQGINTQLFIQKEYTGKVRNKGYIIEAEDQIYASVRINSGLSQNGYVHAGGLVSKGNSALGKTFRLGAMLNPVFDISLLNFASILSTENGTKVTISNIPNGTILVDGTTVAGPIIVTLDKNESYVLALENIFFSTPSNSSKMIGALVESDKAVVVNSGSFGGSNSTILDPNGNLSGRDVGFDQIVPLEKTGKEYIFVKGLGTDELERVILIAHENQTNIFLNGNATAVATLDKGEYIALDGSQYVDGNLYVSTSENVFAYQCIGGSPSPANQNLFFVPPLNCATPSIVDNIPMIESIGNISYNGGLNIVTEKGATVSIKDTPITAVPVAITGNPKYERYSLDGLTGNISIKSSKQVYVSYFGTNGAATYGGYYSGFDTKPEVVTDKITVNSSACIPNVNLKVSTLSSYDTFQWYFNDAPIPGATSNSYIPTQSGYYQVKGSIFSCGTAIFSDKIPVSDCPLDSDNDGTNNNIDIDLDNDGIHNDFEAANYLLNQSDPKNSSDYTGTVSGDGSITGKIYYGFVSEVPAGKAKKLTYTLNFNTPTSIRFGYILLHSDNTQITPTSDYLNTEGDFILRVPTDKTLTLLDPYNELLVDTDYDGIYESGVTEFTSFEIRFRLKGPGPVAPGALRFTISSYLTDSITYEHHNLSENTANKATFALFTRHLLDFDLDGIPNLLDLDSDNDGIPDTIEAQGKGFKVYSGIDTNKNGLDDAFEPGLDRINTDNDRNPYSAFDVFDLDSDNDGIFDLVESGNNAIDANNDGVIDGPSSAFGSNGLFDTLETSPDSGKLNYVIADTDTDGTLNYIDLDSDNDLCNDVIEAGFTDNNYDGILGDNPVTVNARGMVTSGTNGYTTPHSNYITAASITITDQPADQSQCELQNTSFTISTNTVDSFQWQLSTDGGILWTAIANNAIYSGSSTATLQIIKVTSAMNGHKYRVSLNKNGNSCGLISSAATLTILALPSLTTPLTLVQCDQDTDGISTFNLTEKNSFISTNYLNETFSFYQTAVAANTANLTLLIPNPTTYTSTNATVWARIENSSGCFSVAQLNLVVSTTQIDNAFTRSFNSCDDYIDTENDDKDGIAVFNFSSVTTDIQAMLPTSNLGYSIKYFANENDALAEINTITNPDNYRNTGYPNQQKIWVRIDSNLDNSCFGLGDYITLTVDAFPNINENDDHSEDQLVCSNLPSFFVQLTSGLQDATPSSNYTYVWRKNGTILPTDTAAILNVNEVGDYTIEVTTAAGCSRTRTIKVTASDLAEIESITVVDLSDSNTITIMASGKGLYEYSLNEPYGPFQSSPVFENAPIGIHEVYINDKNGCGAISKTIAVIGAPKFFTPNGDGYNDFWNVKGLNTALNKNSIIYIFDRYGKLMKQVLPTNTGWDGTLNGIPVSADDYWYTVKLEDGRETKGHFSLKR